jgi:type IV secretory pathway component VirB8
VGDAKKEEKEKQKEKEKEKEKPNEKKVAIIEKDKMILVLETLYKIIVFTPIIPML